MIIHHIIAKDTSDENVMAALNKKDQTQTALLAAVKAEIDSVKSKVGNGGGSLA